MKAMFFALALLAACRPNDGGTQRSAANPAGSTTQAAQPSDRENEMLERADAGRIKGDSSAPVWMVEVSDFQCPFCRRFWQETYPIIEREMIRTGMVRLAYVNLPLQMHPNALPAAEAAMCASEQGRFWPVHDSLFATQGRWAELQGGVASAYFDSLAVAAGVDEGTYRACMDSGVMRRLIAADVSRAANAGINSTPFFFMGNERINGAAPIDEFRAALARALAARRPGGGGPTGGRASPAP